MTGLPALPVAPTVATVTWTATTMQVVVAASTTRSWLRLQNIGSVTIYLGFGSPDAVLNKGVRLSAGDVYVISAQKGNLTTDQVSAISAAGTKILYVISDAVVGHPLMTLTAGTVNVTTSTGEVIAANASRKYLYLRNDSDEVLYLKLGAAAVLNEGIRLNATSGLWELSPRRGNLYTGAINAIHGGTGNKVILTAEGA